MSPVTVMISLGVISMGGTVGIVFGIADWLRVRRIAWRRAAVWSFGSGWSFEWTLMTKVELMAENRPTYENKLDSSRGRTIRDVRKSRWY